MCGYRDLEFSLKDVPKSELLTKIDEVIIIVENTLDKMSEAQLQEEFPILIFDEKKSVLFTLVHLTTHLAYHLWQVNYHIRLLVHT